MACKGGKKKKQYQMINDYTIIETKSALLWLDKFLEENNIDNKVRCNLYAGVNKLLSKHRYFTMESLKYIKECILKQYSKYNITKQSCYALSYSGPVNSLFPSPLNSGLYLYTYVS